MEERRRFHRVNFSSPAVMIHNEIIYRVRLENICLRGALLSSSDSPTIPVGESCSVLVSADDSESPIVATAQVAYAFFSMVGVQFLSFSDDGETRLYQLMQNITDNPERLRLEWEELLGERETQYLASP